jgi:FtsZ-binding cell division protein ZapB
MQALLQAQVSQLEKEKSALGDKVRQLQDKSSRLEAENVRLKQLTTKQESLLTEVGVGRWWGVGKWHVPRSYGSSVMKW